MKTSSYIEEGKIKTYLTGPGWVLMFVLITMLIGSINYSNNMAYIMCFLLTALMMVAFLYTRNNLKGLEILNILSYPVFAGDTLQFSFELHNRTRGRRIAVYGVIDNGYGPLSVEDFSGPFIVEPLSRVTGKISIPVPRRGRFNLSHITLFSVYPLGLFQVKYHCHVDKWYIVYPKPYGNMVWPEPEIHDDENSEGFYSRGGDDFVGIRPYRPGESQHHVDWKAVARGRPMSIKEFTGGGSSQQWFDWNSPGNLETEDRISQLTRWVLEADQQGHEFGLRIPGNEIKPDLSPGHTVKCLETLALFNAGKK
jgi:uncharacterized protein (DUF58 family)